MQSADDTKFITHWPLVTYQTILLFTIFAITAHDPIEAFDDGDEEDDDDVDAENSKDDNDNDLDRVHTIFTHLVHTCRVQGVFHYPSMLAQTNPNDPIVFRFSSLEELKYFALVLFKVDHLFSRLMDFPLSPPNPDNVNNNNNNNAQQRRLRISDLQFPLPDSGYMFETPSIREFLRRRERQARDPSLASDRQGAIVADDRQTMMDRAKNPWICDIFAAGYAGEEEGRKRGKVEQRKRRKAWMSLGTWLGYMFGLDPVGSCM